ncbi:MAG: 50S ribosomal protein L11 methyltransferase [Desulfuromonadales bacterium]|nr:50S ribosomal protein L11 methyltransferase [Desulfuromonadales bacterium]MBN2791174.1 50S ribosomal protein L11 methyltransferase [Desulfuromonadales bacterium]
MREDYKPFEVGERFLIQPSDISTETTGRLNLVMERGAFGSGEHETTRSCLELLETLSLKNCRKILDLGSGTGILTIAARLLGSPASAWCVDIDQTAVNSCRRNCALNGLDQRVHHLCTTLETLDEEDFDLILANIYGDILLDVAVPLVEKAQSGAYILLSGILWEYNFDIKKKYISLGCELIKSRLLDEFATLLFRKN